MWLNLQGKRFVFSPASLALQKDTSRVGMIFKVLHREPQVGRRERAWTPQAEENNCLHANNVKCKAAKTRNTVGIGI